MKTLFTLSICFISSFTFAMLSSDSTRTLSEHLLEVNKEWVHFLGDDPQYSEQISFPDDSYRIQKHLFEVCLLLRERSAAYPEDQKQRRLELIQQLYDYAVERKFPINTLHKQRKPYFIDYRGTACAVGYLMLQNGFDQEALLVHKEINTAYVKEIPQSWLESWMDYSKFSLDELALIQPGYPPLTVWNNHGQSIEGTVYALHDLGGEIILGGDFTFAGQEYNVASYDGSGEVELWDEPINGVIRDFEMYQGELWACGTFVNGVYDLATWNGESWTYSNAASGKTAEAYDLLRFGDHLLVASSMSGFAGYDYPIYRLTDDSWTMIGNFDNRVMRLYDFNGQVLAAGDFQNVLSGDVNEEVNFIAKLNMPDSWENWGEGLNIPIYALSEFEGTLIASGNMALGELDPMALVYLRIEGEWQSGGASMPNMEEGEGQAIHRILAHDEGYYLLGDFTASSLMSFGSEVAYIQIIEEGETYNVYPQYEMAYTSYGVYDGLIWNDRLYIAGDFESSEFVGQPRKFASTTLSTSISEISLEELTVYPNPAHHILQIQLEYLHDPALIHVLDMSGRKVLETTLNTFGRINLDISSLEHGSYIIQVFNRRGDELGRSRFIKNKI